jgi:hypothetical protein
VSLDVSIFNTLDDFLRSLGRKMKVLLKGTKRISMRIKKMVRKMKEVTSQSILNCLMILKLLEKMNFYLTS